MHYVSPVIKSLTIVFGLVTAIRRMMDVWMKTKEKFLKKCILDNK